MDEIGKVAFRRLIDGSTLIFQADPRVRVHSELIAEVRAGDIPFIRLDHGDVLTIRDDYGARFIYRIDWDDFADGGYLAEWPD